jgi:O-antigen/teichoic acid export membrane protein
VIFRRLAKHSVIYGGADFLTKLFTFFTFPIIVAVLSPKIFGTLEMILTSTALLGLIMNCGLNNSVQRFYWDKNTDKNDQTTIVTAGFISQILLGIVAVVLVSLLIPFVLSFPAVAELSVTSHILFTALILMALSQWSQFILDVIRLHFTPWRFFSLALLSRVVSICLGLVAVVWLGLGLNGLLGAQVLVLFVVCPIGLFMIRKDINLLRINLEWVKQLL